MAEGDTMPLQPLRVGGGKCGELTDKECRNGGACIANKCECVEGWVGSHCMSAAGFDDVDWEPSDPIFVSLPFIPSSLRMWLALTVLICCACFAYIYSITKQDNPQYTPVGTV